MLKSLIIKNFRSLDDFKVEKLGRVNLIVGKNNSGKSSVLEALRIFAGNAHQELLEQIAQSHDEKCFFEKGIADTSEVSLPYEDFFSGRKFPTDERPIVICEQENDAALKIFHVYGIEKEYTATDENGKKEVIQRLVWVTTQVSTFLNRVIGEGLLIKKNGEATTLDFNVISPEFRRFVSIGHRLPCSFIPTQLVSTNEIANDWDSIALTDEEETVKQAMKIILPDFEAITFVNDLSNTRDKSMRRVAKVKIKGSDRPVPLSSLGDGMVRILQIALKLVTAKGGFLLIDEFENGLHYSIQEKVWSLIFDLSKSLDIQIFATTHSWDCIESFAKVAIDKQDIDGLLFRVGQSVRNSDKGRVIATVFEKEQLFSITQSDVEVR
jgi:AAA15 family ATPase/GTPase